MESSTKNLAIIIKENGFVVKWKVRERVSIKMEFIKDSGNKENKMVMGSFFGMMDISILDNGLKALEKVKEFIQKMCQIRNKINMLMFKVFIMKELGIKIKDMV